MEYHPLTTPQKNIWNLQKYYADTAISNLCGAVFYQEKRREDLMKQSIRLFIRSQSGIRLRFCEREEPMQYIYPEDNEDIPVMTFSSMEEFDRYAEDFARVPLGLTDRAMYRFVVFHVKERSGILVVLSHLVADAWTFGLMANRLDAAYRILEKGIDEPLQQGDYRTFIEKETLYFKSERYQKDRTYWEQIYTCRPEESPVRLHSLPAASAAAKRVTEVLPLSLERRLEAFGREFSVTPAVLFETALVLYLARLNPENRTVTIGVPVLNRSNAKEKEIAGMFISTMPLTVEVEGRMSVLELARQIGRRHMDIFRHQKYPYGEILRTLREKQIFSGNLYDVMVSYQNAKTMTETDTRWYSNGYSEIPLTVHIDNRDGKESHTVNVDYQTEVFCPEEISWLLKRLEYILEQVAEKGDKRIEDIDILPERERKKVTEGFNDTAVDYPRDQCVHELFEEQAERTPERVAIVSTSGMFTYRQLNEESNCIAYSLMEDGVQTGDIVAFALSYDIHIVSMIFAIMKVGAAYLPIDLKYPPERIDYILSDSNAKRFITEKDINDLIKNSKIRNPKKTITGMNICYCIYTSGSSGKPKGVMISNSSLSHYISHCKQIYGEKDINMPLFTSVCVDLTVTSIFLPLLTGGTIFIYKDDLYINLLNILKNKKLSIIKLTPTHLKILNTMYEGRILTNICSLIVGGEQLYYEDIMKFRDKYGKHICIHNEYGPTETTVGCGDYICNENDCKTLLREDKDISVPIGKPISNTQIYILDPDNNILPIGVPGELCIAGDGVGLGYLNQPELTAQRFVPNPFATHENGHGKVMYRTGDLARWRADGEIEYLGRMDTQVKIRGLRIELGEIESAMVSFPGVRLAAVTDRRDENGRQFLVGYYTAEEAVDERKLRKHLSSRLPGYMVPNYFRRLTAMPMTPSGKLDRKELPMPDLSVRETGYLAPETETQKKLARIWQELLGLEKVGKTDDFFELGGDSLLAISMLNEIMDGFSAELTMREVMEGSTLEQLALCIERHGEAPGYETDRMKPLHQDRYVLLPQQKAVYAACKKAPDSLLYNMPAAITLPGEIDRERLKRAIRRVAEHTKILRSRIVSEADEIYGVYDEDIRICFEEYGTNETVPDDRSPSHFLSGKDFLRPFDLEKGPLFRVGFTEDAMLFDIHHIIADGESVNLILNNIARAYEGRGLQEPELWYGDYAACFPTLDFTEHKDYFKNLLACGHERLELPGTKTAGTGGESISYRIPEEVFSRAKRYAERQHLTDTMVFLGAYGILLSGYTGKKDILSSIILQNRIRRKMRQVEGMFVNTLPVRFAVTGNVRDYFEGIKEMVLDLFRYQELPFREIADAVGMADKTAVNTSFIYQADGDKKLILNGRELLPQPLDTHTAKFDFFMEVTPQDHGGRIRLEYDCGKYDKALMDELAEAYIRILEQLTQERVKTEEKVKTDRFNSPDLSACQGARTGSPNADDLAEISVLSDETCRRIIEGFNDTAVDYPRDQCVHELFVKQAEKTPERAALVFRGRQFTYRQLDEMSNSLAHFLRRKGIKRGDVVPILAVRSWHIVAAILGILKAGGAYMPVSPDYPRERIQQMMETAGSRLLLQYGCEEKGKALTADGECVDLAAADLGADTGKVMCANCPEDLCYVIFTSGSTGTPKGVSISHRNVVNYCDNNEKNVCRRVIDDAHGSIVSVTNMVFDIFVTETLLPLLNGMAVYFADDAEAMHQERLAGLVGRNGIDVIQTTPTRMRSYILDKGNTGYLRSFRKIILGGEAFPVDLFRELRSYTDADIYNIYGPAETTVWSSGSRVEGEDITIGRPIANTQIYILSENNAPVPIDVPGELCIAGDGVGLGYLNQPELTAQRFVPNPFATHENGHGKVMYHTGDLARWRADGEIEYLGRMDTQVKIRGLRIELGEIGSAMASFPGVQLTAAADRKDENGRQFLVGYYTSAEELDERELRRHLLSVLPKYMVPNFLLRLAAMPMTPSGKTDRKNLPLPEMTGREDRYLAPQTEIQKRLCALAEEVLGLERVGVEDDFFELGADSLTAITYVAKAHELGIRIPLQDVFDHPSVRSLSAALEAGNTPVIRLNASDFEKYRALLSGGWTEEASAPKERALGNVLLTGATGFLGAHVLDALMREEAGKIYCLVRRNGEESPVKRLERILGYYFDGKYDAALGQRLIVVEGDVEEEGLWERLPWDVQTVIHTAASVKHYGSYAYFRGINREGTRHMAEYAGTVGARLIHISTLSVSGNGMADDFTVYRSDEEKQFDETSLYIGQPLDNVYVRSKFEAECQVYDKILEGLAAKVIRVGNLTNRLSDFRFQPNYRENAFLTRFKALLELGAFPDYLMPLYSEFSPVDKTAEGIVKIARYAGEASVYHLYNNRPIYYNRFLESIRRLGIPMKVVGGEAFYEALRRTMEEERTAYIYEALQNDMDEQGRLVYDSNIHIVSDLTLRFLEKAGFAWNETDFEYIRGYVEYFRRLGYLNV